MKRLVAPTIAALLTSTSIALAQPEPEPWSDADPREEPTRWEFGDYGIRTTAEYRANWIYIRPVALNSTNQRNASWLEHRLRWDTSVDYDEKVRLVLSIDGIDGTVWGDNGAYGGNPSKNAGVRAAASNPNNAKPTIVYLGSGDPTNPDSYGYGYAPNDYFKLRRAYGEVMLPVGMLRIGRQPTTDGSGVLVASGDGRTNRFGYSYIGDSTDRILFATKPLEGLKPAAERDKSRTRGLFLITMYDRVATDELRIFGDDMHSAAVVLRYRAPNPARRQTFEVQTAYAHRWESEYDTNINVFNARVIARSGKLSAAAEGAHVRGATREVSEALALINADPIVRQKVDQWGARGAVRWDEPAWTAYFEVDFATGDRNPNPGTDLTQLYFAEDANVGLLMFERILAFESARSQAAGVEILKLVGAPTFPVETVNTESAFTNALAFFPQFDFRPKDNLLLRGGVLAAWAPSGLVDPVQSLYLRDGREIEDDLVNFNNGPPGNFYGVELDGRFQWRYEEHFIFDLESAILFPGDAFHNEHGQATRSFLIQGRTTFAF